VWDFRRIGVQPPSQAAAGQAPAAPGPSMQAALAPPGEYTVVLEIADRKLSTRATVRPVPVHD
jgi:hypothetical protein